LKRITGAFLLSALFLTSHAVAQLQWKNVDSAYQPLPKGVHVFTTTDLLDGKPNIAFYVSIDTKDRSLQLLTDTAKGRRFTPSQFYEREDHPLIVMNCTFFEFAHNSNLNVVMNKGKILALNEHNFALGGKDTFMYNHPFRSALGIRKNRTMDVAWTFTDSTAKHIYAMQTVKDAWKDSNNYFRFSQLKNYPLEKWKMQTAFGGGPVLIQDGEIKITNNEERRWGGKAINEKHPRTAAGYTVDGKLILLVIQGRFDKIAEGATLTQEAKIFKDLGCVEALNLDGGGSSCLLVNGKETIKPSDKAGEQRPVPAVFMVKVKK
jgi:exopolysaccharide biosynthesis protein